MEQIALIVGDIITLTRWMAGSVMPILFVWLILVRLQSEHTVRLNFPITDRLRCFPERQGEPFRWYFFSHDQPGDAV